MCEARSWWIPGPKGGGRLFKAAFTQSRNPMALLDERRCHVEVNGAYVSLLGYPVRELLGHPIYEFIVGGPQMTAAGVARTRLTRAASAVRARCAAPTATPSSVQWAATPERVTGRRLVLFVALSTSRWGAHPRRARSAPLGVLPLTARELEVVELIAMGTPAPRSPTSCTSPTTPSGPTPATRCSSRAHARARTSSRRCWAKGVPAGGRVPRRKRGGGGGKAPRNRETAPARRPRSRRSAAAGGAPERGFGRPVKT